MHTKNEKENSTNAKQIENSKANSHPSVFVKLLTTNKQHFCQVVKYYFADMPSKCNITHSGGTARPVKSMPIHTFECGMQTNAASRQPLHGVARIVAANFNQNPRNTASA